MLTEDPTKFKHNEAEDAGLRLLAKIIARDIVSKFTNREGGDEDGEDDHLSNQ